MDAKELNTPIICSVSDIAPIEMSKPMDRSKSIEGLKQVGSYNNSAHERAVTGFVKLTSNARAIRRNAERLNNGGR